MKHVFRHFLSNESGATAIEYALIASLVSIAIIAGATVLGVNLGLMFDKLSLGFG